MLLNEMCNSVCYLLCRFPPPFVYIRKEAAILRVHSYVLLPKKHRLDSSAKKKYSLHSPQQSNDSQCQQQPQTAA